MIRKTRPLSRRAVLAGAVVMTTPALAQSSRPDAWSFDFPGLDGGTVRLASFRRKVLLVVNTASHCGFTPQFRDLQAIHERYGPRGVVVIGVPSNDFGGQEPGTAAQIKEVCSGDYGVTFTMAGKQRVIGADAHPFYRWAARERATTVPRWNFHKIVIGRDGHVAGAFSSMTRPTDAELVAVIEAALAADAKA